jgi:hypothetical protein
VQVAANGVGGFPRLHADALGLSALLEVLLAGHVPGQLRFREAFNLLHSACGNMWSTCATVIAASISRCACTADQAPACTPAQAAYSRTPLSPTIAYALL